MRIQALLLVTALAVPLSVPAAEGEVGLTLGLTLPADETTGLFGQTLEPDWTLGLRGGLAFSDRVEWFADLTYTDLETVVLMEGGESLALRTGIDYMMNPGRDERWFVSAGAGYGDIAYGEPFYDFDYMFASFGFGQRYLMQEGRRLRWEIRADLNPAGAGPIDEWFLNVHSLISLTWGVGGSGGRAGDDPDRDGVPRNRDHCPGTEPGWPVDDRGCPADTDGDGLPDGMDRCPDSHPRAQVGDDGCPVDTDGDGVSDGLDACPGTPAGAMVGLRGCPLDTDRDGVYDGIDRCPGTAAGKAVDQTGCPR